MGRRWIVVDTNVFCLAGYQAAGRGTAREEEYLARGGEACEFLCRMVEYCQEYGLAVHDGGLILEEYEQRIPRGSFGYYAFTAMVQRIPGKSAPFKPRNPDWVDRLERGSDLDRHDRRFLATALATPDKILVSTDTVFTANAGLLHDEGVHVYDVEDANGTL